MNRHRYLGLFALAALGVVGLMLARRSAHEAIDIAPRKEENRQEHGEVRLVPAPGRSTMDTAAPSLPRDGSGRSAVSTIGDAPATAAETSGSEYPAPLPPGGLEVQVTLDSQRVEAATVSLWPWEAGLPLYSLRDFPRGLREQPTRLDGVARFDRVEPGRWVIHAHVEPDLEAEAVFTLAPEVPVWRVALYFGSCGVQGHVYEPDGSPRVGSKIEMKSSSIEFQSTCAWSRADGFYRISGLQQGAYHIDETPPGDQLVMDSRTLKLVLEPGEWKTIDFGSAVPLPNWLGSVLRIDDSPLAEPGAFWLIDLQQEVSRPVTYDATGAFRCALAPGTYAISFYVWDGARKAGTLDIGTADVHQDVVLPGTELYGRIIWLGASPGGSQALASVNVRLRAVDGLGESRKATHRFDDQYGFLGVEPGEYVLSCEPHRIEGATGGELEVLVPSNRAYLQVDLRITDP